MQIKIIVINFSIDYIKEKYQKEDNESDESEINYHFEDEDYTDFVNNLKNATLPSYIKHANYF